MKFLPILLYFVLAALTVKAQKIRVSDTTNRWMVGFDYLYSGTPTNPVYRYNVNKYYYAGTEIYGGKVYSKMGGSAYGNLFRDDTVDNVVYRLNSTTGQDVVVFDYNKQVGDTIDGYTHYNIITKVDSIQIQNVWHKTFEFINTTISYTGMIIEGIGYTYNVVNPAVEPNAYTRGNHIICFMNSGVSPMATSIPTFEPNRCADTVLSISSTNFSGSDAVRLFPQPAGEQLTIDLPQHLSTGKLVVISFTGQVVYTAAFENEQQLTIPNKDWKGVYFYRIVDLNNNIFTGKVIFE